MKRRGLGPEYDNFLRLGMPPVEASLVGRVVGALKLGALLAIGVALTLIYLDTFAGVRLDRRLSTLAVVLALAGPALAILVQGLRARRRGPDPDRPDDEPPQAGP